MLLTSVFGVSSAWIVSRYYLFKSSFLEWMLILPLAIPSYITAYAYAGFFDYGGWLSRLTANEGINSFKVDVMNIYGLIFVLSISLFPYVYVSARAIFLHQSFRLIEASKMLGAGETKTFFKIVLPIARPAIVGGILLVLMEVLNDYGAAKYYGVPTFTTGIFRSWFSLGEPATAVYLSALLLLIIFLLVSLEKIQRGKRLFSAETKGSFRLPKKKLKTSKRLLAISIVSIPISLGFGLPLIQLLYWGFLTYSTVFTSSFLVIALQSLGIATLTGVGTVFFAVLLLYVPQWNRLRILKNSARIAILGYAVPGSVIAIGVMILTLGFDKWLIKFFDNTFHITIGLLFNGTIVVLIYAYIIRFIAVAFNPLEASKTKISDRLSESSRLLGKGRVATFFKIDFPLLKTGMASAFILVFVDTMKELPLTLILKPYRINTLAVKAYEYASDELILEASIPSLCIIATGIVPIILLNKFILK